MTIIDRDPESRERLIAYYKEGSFHGADFAICMAATQPAQYIDSLDRCRLLVFALEVWCALCGRPHPALAHVEVDFMQWERQRCACTSDQAVTALFWLSQSPWGAEFADDTHDLRPRLFAMAQEYDQAIRSMTDTPST